jgi:uncharacterized protein YukE
VAEENIHVEEGMMDVATRKAADVQTSIMDFERRLSGIAEMVKNVWGGKAKQAFDQKHAEITQYLGNNAQDALGISEGTNVAKQVSVTADDDAARIISAINATHVG